MGMDMNPVLLYITTANREEAILIGNALLQKKQVACINILDNITSLYWWQGVVENTQETLMIAKTFDSYIEPVMELVRSMHTYTCPAILSVPLNNGNPDYITWMHEQLI